MKKYIIPVAAFIAGMAIVPSVFAETKDYGTAVNMMGDAADEFDEGGVEGDVTVTYTDAKGKTITASNSANDVVNINYANMTLHYTGHDKDTNGFELAEGYARVIFQAQAPEGFKLTNNATYKIEGPNGLIKSGPWTSVMNGDTADTLNIAGMYKRIELADVEEAARAGKDTLTYTYLFDWDGDQTYDKTVHLNIKLDTLTIYEEAEDERGDDEPVYGLQDYIAYAKEGPVAEAEEPGAETEEPGEENPNAADTIATYLTIATVALLGLGATAFVAKKSNR